MHVIQQAKQEGVVFVIKERQVIYYDYIYKEWSKCLKLLGIGSVETQKSRIHNSRKVHVELIMSVDPGTLNKHTVLINTEQQGNQPWNWKSIQDCNKWPWNAAYLTVNFSLYATRQMCPINSNIVWFPFTLGSQLPLLSTPYIKSIDVLFMGWMTPHRSDIITELQKKGLNVINLKSFDINQIVKHISQAKVFLGLHKDDIGKDMEYGRLCRSLGQHTIIIMEQTRDTEVEQCLMDVVQFCPAKDLVQACCATCALNTAEYEARVKRQVEASATFSIQGIVECLLQIPSRPLIMKVDVITANYGNIDKHILMPTQETSHDISFHMYTDQPCHSPIWNTYQEAFPPAHFSNRLRAKYFKIMASSMSRHQHADVIIWIDSQFQILTPMFISWVLEQLGDKDMIVFPHHERNCIYKEQEFITTKMRQQDNYLITRYRNQPIQEQVKYYDLQEYPKDNNLYSCGLFAYRVNDTTRNLMREWWEHNIQWSIQDQLSLPYVMHKLHFTPATFPCSIIGNEHFKYVGHQKLA